MFPRADEIGYSFLRESRRPRKVRDFFEFTQVAAARWAATLRDVLKAAGGDVLVTLGQDEGGTGTRPAQLLHADAVDYTAVHTWWGNDDLLWDGVMTKAVGKPNMHQETGLMSLHDPDGAPWRTPAAAADLLDRKFAYAFAGRGAGVIQWAWNVNPYHAHRQRGHHRLQPARRDGQARDGRRPASSRRSSRRRRPSSTTSRPSRWPSWSRTRVSSRDGRAASTTRSGSSGCWPSATASFPRPSPTSGSPPSSSGA